MIKTVSSQRECEMRDTVGFDKIYNDYMDWDLGRLIFSIQSTEEMLLFVLLQLVNNVQCFWFHSCWDLYLPNAIKIDTERQWTLIFICAANGNWFRSTKFTFRIYRLGHLLIAGDENSKWLPNGLDTANMCVCVCVICHINGKASVKIAFPKLAWARTAVLPLFRVTNRNYTLHQHHIQCDDSFITRMSCAVCYFFFALL